MKIQNQYPATWRGKIALSLLLLFWPFFSAWILSLTSCKPVDTPASSTSEEQPKNSSDKEEGKTVAWIFIKYSGGFITDIWLVDSNKGVSVTSHGFKFPDKCGNILYMSRTEGEAIEVKNKYCAKWHQYLEYHMQFDSVSYNQRYFLWLKSLEAQDGGPN